MITEQQATWKTLVVNVFQQFVALFFFTFLFLLRKEKCRNSGNPICYGIFTGPSGET